MCPHSLTWLAMVHMDTGQNSLLAQQLRDPQKSSHLSKYWQVAGEMTPPGVHSWNTCISVGALSAHCMCNKDCGYMRGPGR